MATVQYCGYTIETMAAATTNDATPWRGEYQVFLGEDGSRELVTRKRMPKGHAEFAHAVEEAMQAARAYIAGLRPENRSFAGGTAE